MRNPKIRVGEKGGFKWTFKRFGMDIQTVSGNFKASFTAGEHPYGYLISGTDDLNIEGYCQMLYMVGMLLTTDQGFVDDLNKAIKKYQKRMEKADLDDSSEDVALEEEKALQEYIELPKKDQRKAEKDIDRRFKKTAKKVKDGNK